MSKGSCSTSIKFVTHKLAAVSAALLVGLFAVSAQAFPALDLNPNGGTPDIMSGLITVSYAGNDQSGALNAEGMAFEINPPGAPEGTIISGTFDIDAQLDHVNGVATGSVTITGETGYGPFNSGTLLTGNLIEFGAGSSNPLEFLFEVTGGDAASLYGGDGSTFGVVLSESGYSGSFATGFSNMGMGLADTFGLPVPAPGTMALVLLGCGLLLARQRSSFAHNAG
jgi:hypothetical protein